MKTRRQNFKGKSSLAGYGRLFFCILHDVLHEGKIQATLRINHLTVDLKPDPFIKVTGDWTRMRFQLYLDTTTENDEEWNNLKGTGRVVDMLGQITVCLQASIFRARLDEMENLTVQKRLGLPKTCRI